MLGESFYLSQHSDDRRTRAPYIILPALFKCPYECVVFRRFTNLVLIRSIHKPNIADCGPPKLF